MYSGTIIGDEAHSMEVMQGMEEAWTKEDESFPINVLLNEPSLVPRAHAVCILAEVGGEKCVPSGPYP